MSTLVYRRRLIEPRTCACGCGVEFNPYNTKQIYSSPTCKNRAARSRKKVARWIEELQYEDRCTLDDMQQSRDPFFHRAHELIINAGISQGWRAAAQLLRDLMYAQGLLYEPWDGCPRLPLMDRYGIMFRPGVFVEQEVSNDR